MKTSMILTKYSKINPKTGLKPLIVHDGCAIKIPSFSSLCSFSSKEVRTDRAAI